MKRLQAYRINAPFISLLILIVSVSRVNAAEFIWPLNRWPDPALMTAGAQGPDEMNVSFGPRINNNKWDFHDGIDLPPPDPATPNPKVYAMRGGIVHKAGPADTTYSSRHVILKVKDPLDNLKEDLYLVYLHLNSIELNVVKGANVNQGDPLGTLGGDNAAYGHLHMEFRKGGLDEIYSVHPMGYLPYHNTLNFTAPVLDRANRLGTEMAARLAFETTSNGTGRNEGDLRRVEVDFWDANKMLSRRTVDFNDKFTINEGNSDYCMFKNDIAVEGYQQSNLKGHSPTRDDLKYGILLRNIPSECKKLVIRVFDVGYFLEAAKGNATPMQTTVTLDSVQNQVARDEKMDFESGKPAGWSEVTSATATTVSYDASAAHNGSLGLLSIDASTTETTTQRAGVETANANSCQRALKTSQ